MRHLARFALLLGLGAVAACGGSSDDGGGGGGAGISAAQACADLAASLCKKVDTCSQAFLTLAYGDQATCEARFESSCAAMLSAPATAATPAKVETCSQALAGASCGALLDHDLPSACQASGGSGANGTACGDDWQCASGRCSVPSDSTCGTCGDRSGGGGACKSDDDCQYGLVCANDACVAPGGDGASCDKAHPCATGLVCNGTAGGTTSGTCGSGGGAGASCDADVACDKTQALFCNPKTKVCQSVVFAAAGQPCGWVDPNIAVCSASGTCKGAKGLTPGTCVGAAADGAACSTGSDGPSCMPNAKCVDSVCKPSDPAACK